MGHEHAGAWWHKSFVRGRPQDLKYIVRTRLKGNKALSVVDVPPIFPSTMYDASAGWVKEETVAATVSTSSFGSDDELNDIGLDDYDFEGWFENNVASPKSVTFTTPLAAREKRPSATEDLDCSNNLNYAIKKIKKANRDFDIPSEGVFNPNLSFMTPHPSYYPAPYDTMANTRQPVCVSDAAAPNSQDIDPLDEFSAFIDKTIQPV